MKEIEILAREKKTFVDYYNNVTTQNFLQRLKQRKVGGGDPILGPFSYALKVHLSIKSLTPVPAILRVPIRISRRWVWLSL